MLQCKRGNGNVEVQKMAAVRSVPYAKTYHVRYLRYAIDIRGIGIE